VSEERERQSAATAAAEHVRAIVEAAERETEAQLAQLQRAADGLAARADDIEQQLERLTQGVRSAIHALREDLRELRAVSPAEAPVRAAPAAPEPAAATPAARAAQPAVTPAGAEGARVIALNMALGGASRDETASYLAENFELDDPDALLDEVYARVGGS
jgi:DNA repair exonuclease SbcCD ATPase subunit